MHISTICRALKSLGLSTCFALATALFAVSAAPSTASAQVVLSVTVAPPILPVYAQPVCPGEGFIWTPGYYAGRIWVPGRWVHHDERAFAGRDYHYDHRDYHFDNRGWDHGRR